jgi:tetratricopeptide (TPR) repeat protein
VVICDYNLADGKDGQQVLEEARHLGYLAYACCFFLITAESNLPLVLGALEQQPDEYMVKPINSDVLQHRLAASLKQKCEVNLIDKALKEGNKSYAIQCCKTLKNSNIKRSLYLSKLEAELCMDLKRYDQAETVYQDLLKIRSFPWAKFGLGKIACLKGERGEAASIFRALIQDNQHYLEAYDWLARVLEAEGQLEEAQEELQKAAKLSPKLVRRQRNLGRLAHANGDSETAMRAFQSAVRWGEHSCFASADEYRQLANLYLRHGGDGKVQRLLSGGRKRFNREPSDLVQILSLQAHADHRCNNKDAACKKIAHIKHLISDHKGLVAADGLLTAADDLIQLSYTDEAKTLLEVLVCNHHDDDVWSERVVTLLHKHGLANDAEELMERSKGVLRKIHSKCLDLLENGGLEQAVALLNRTVDEYPSNRTIVLMAASAMIDYMTEHGLDPGFLFRCRYSLNRLLAENSKDAAADKYLKALKRIAT